MNCTEGVFQNGSLQSNGRDGMQSHRIEGKSSPTFIDLFAGCGGLSLGLSQAGWRGRFAIERAEDAFQTFRANFLSDTCKYKFDWPAWLQQSAHGIEDVLQNHKSEISKLNGQVDLIAGGPPCQGFSFAGRRSSSDPRNKLFQKYVEFVKLVRPCFLLLENVPGMQVAHKYGNGKNKKNYYQKLIEELDAIDYAALGRVLDASDFGVPQRRSRLVVIGIDLRAFQRSILPDAMLDLYSLIEDIFSNSKREGQFQLDNLGGHKVTARSALSDLEVGKNNLNGTVEYKVGDSRSGYRQVKYRGPKTKFQKSMHEGADELPMDSMRLANHRVETTARFKEILDVSEGRRGVNLSPELRQKLGMLKHRVVPLDPNKQSPTLTTLPDDILHYCEPRILTVREYARLQSFPDWFVFRGKYTTGGAKRKSESPRYTQVGNAVPPLLGRALGRGILRYLQDNKYDSSRHVSDVSNTEYPERPVHITDPISLMMVNKGV